MDHGFASGSGQLRASQINTGFPEQREQTAQTSEWSLLPVEIRLIIFEKVAEIIGQGSKNGRPTKVGLAQCAAVCKEWQLFFGKLLFRHLTLTQSGLFGLRDVSHQRQFVEHLTFRVELVPYHCDTCVHRFTSASPHNDADAEMFRASINALFWILESWDIQKPGTTTGLTLELGAYSPSDSEHTFREMYLHTSSFAGEDFAKLELPATDLSHGWLNGRRWRSPNAGELFRLHEVLVSPSIYEGPVVVKAVKHLVIRREMRRRLDIQDLQTITKRLPNLESMHFEPWRSYEKLLNGRLISDGGTH
ncbi:hypothetical protein AUP68_12249 [Ilyonectria robusta]